jgi:hypothetical protein
MKRSIKKGLLFAGIACFILSCGAAIIHKDAQTNEQMVKSDQVSEIPNTAASAEEIRLQPGDNLAQKFKEISRSTSVKRIVFEPGDYRVDDTLHLPRTRSLVIIEGNGANLKVRSGIPAFFSLPPNQSKAMEWNKTRYLIQNFGNITGGSRGVFIGSSFNTVIRNIEFIGQEKAAIDLVFCLMSTIDQILVTNVAHDGIVLRTAYDGQTKERVWPGSSFNNSQCNHTVLKSCRVYNKKGCTGTSFKILQTTGVRLVDCISEGWQNRRAVFFDAKDCTTAKYFAIENFHLEHLPTDGALVFRSNGSLVEVDGLFLQHGEPESPAIYLMSNGNYSFKNIPWWPERAWVRSSNSPFVVIENCKPAFSNFKETWVNNEKKGQPVYAPYLNVTNKLVR